jgi:PilZ domain
MSSILYLFYLVVGVRHSQSAEPERITEEAETQSTVFIYPCRVNPMGDERRCTSRYAFAAPAEVTGKGTAVRIGRVRDISAGGSYVALADTLSLGSLVIVTITTPDAIFQCEATVVHSTRGIGVGLEFRDIAPRFQVVLDRWLNEAASRASSQGSDPPARR